MRRGTYRHQIIDFIKTKILAGELKAGERIKEEYIAAETGFSHIHIREALLILSRDGLLHFEDNKGASVIKPSVEEILADYAICGVMEGYIVGVSLPLFTKNDFLKIEAVL